MGLIALNVALIAVGNAQLELLPVFATNEAGGERAGRSASSSWPAHARPRPLPAPGREGARGALRACGRSRSHAGALGGRMARRRGRRRLARGGSGRDARLRPAPRSSSRLGECFDGPNTVALDRRPRAASGLEGRYWALSARLLGASATSSARPSAASSSRRQPLALWPLAAAVLRWSRLGATLAARALASRSSYD